MAIKSPNEGERDSVQESKEGKTVYRVSKCRGKAMGWRQRERERERVGRDG